MGSEDTGPFWDLEATKVASSFYYYSHLFVCIVGSLVIHIL